MFMQREHLTPYLVRELRPLLQQHWRTIAHYQDIPLDPDWNRYDHAQVDDQLRVYTVRTVTGYTLVGYAIFIVNFNGHYRSSLQAVQDVLYLDPSVRKGWTALQFLKWCDAQLQADGVQAVYHHSTAQHDFGVLLRRMGYEQVDIIYARRLDHGSNSSDRHGSGHADQLRRGSDRASQEQQADAQEAGPGARRAEARDRGVARGGAHGSGPGGTESSGVTPATTVGRGEEPVGGEIGNAVDGSTWPGVKIVAGRLA